MSKVMKYFVLLILLSAMICQPAFASGESDPAETIRLAIVITPKYSGLIDFLIKDFTDRTGLSVDLYSGTDVYKRGRQGKADMVISHYGKPALERFVLEGYGTWPRMVFSNQAVLIGPKDDPAKVKGMSSAATALRRIAETKAPFVVNSGRSIAYLETILWASAGGRPAKADWLLDEDVSRARAVRLADKKQAYVFWGAYPFLRYKDKHDSDLEMMVSADPMLQRIMAAVPVNPNKIQRVNFQGAARFLDYLLNPETQAKIAAFRSPDCGEQLWWPAGRDN